MGLLGADVGATAPRVLLTTFGKGTEEAALTETAAEGLDRGYLWQQITVSTCLYALSMFCSLE